MQKVSKTAAIEMAFLELMHGSLAMRCLFERLGFVWVMASLAACVHQYGLKEGMESVFVGLY